MLPRGVPGHIGLSEGLGRSGASSFLALFACSSEVMIVSGDKQVPTAATFLWIRCHRTALAADRGSLPLTMQGGARYRVLLSHGPMQAPEMHTMHRIHGPPPAVQVSRPMRWSKQLLHLAKPQGGPWPRAIRAFGWENMQHATGNDQGCSVPRHIISQISTSNFISNVAEPQHKITKTLRDDASKGEKGPIV